MQRRAVADTPGGMAGGMAAGMVVAMVVAMLLPGCGKKDADDSGSGSIAAVTQIAPDGKEMPATVPTTPVLPTGDGKARCAPNTTIAFVGPLTGETTTTATNVVGGAQLALDRHNKANPGCQVQLQRFDTGVDPQQATHRLIDNPAVLGVVGPVLSGEAKAIGQLFNGAGLASVSPSATSAALTKQGWKTFFRGVANDDVQGTSVAKYLTGVRKLGKVCVVQDSSDYGTGLAIGVITGLGTATDLACVTAVKTGDRDFASAVARVKAAKPDAVFYAGYHQEAAPFVQQLRAAGVTATFVSADGSNAPEFVRQARDSAKGTVLSCSCGPAPIQFATEYRARFNADPGAYSVEGYDLTTILLKGIDSGRTTRAQLLDFVRAYSGDGLARHYQWGPTGELTRTQIWIYGAM